MVGMATSGGRVAACTATKIPFMYLFSWIFRGLNPNFHIHVSLSVFYKPRIGPHISCSRIGRSIVGRYKSLTDTWMRKLGLWPHNSFSGNICFNFRYWFLQCGYSILQHRDPVWNTKILFFYYYLLVSSPYVWSVTCERCILCAASKIIYIYNLQHYTVKKGLQLVTSRLRRENR